jgi:hypothetical protein
VNASLENKLITFENKCLRKITNTNWKDYKLNEILREETDRKYITNIIRRRHWAYIGYAFRMHEDRIPRQVFMWSPSGKRKQGRPITTLKRTITKEITAVNLKIQDLQKLDEDRDTWETMTTALFAKLDTRGK